MKPSLSFVAVAALLLFAPTPALTQDLESMRLAQELADVIGSEDACELDYDQGAIERFIDDRVRDDDMGFTSSLNLFTQGVRFNIAGMSESALTAHCRQIRRVAVRYGFVEE